jgi:biopolymer transport protein TolR
MAMNPNKTFSPGGRGGGRTSLAEINVTPLVDVMLVLLIVFMVSAPLMQQGVEVNLPKADAGALSQTDEPLVISIQKDQTIVFSDKNYSIRSLGVKLASLAASKPNSQILVQADQAVNYGVVAKVMAELKKVKFTRVGLVTDPEK